MFLGHFLAHWWFTLPVSSLSTLIFHPHSQLIVLFPISQRKQKPSGVNFPLIRFHTPVSHLLTAPPSFLVPWINHGAVSNSSTFSMKVLIFSPTHVYCSITVSSLLHHQFFLLHWINFFSTQHPIIYQILGKTFENLTTQSLPAPTSFLYYLL